MFRQILLEKVQNALPKTGEENFFEILKLKIQSYTDNQIEYLIDQINDLTFTDPLRETYHESNQIKWNLYLEIMIQDFASELPNMTLLELITRLGKERSYFAIDLGHGESIDKYNEFGKLREIGRNKLEVISKNIYWENFFPEVQRRIIDSFRNGELILHKMDHDGPFSEDTNKVLDVINQYSSWFDVKFNKNIGIIVSKNFLNNTEMRIFAEIDFENQTVLQGIYVLYPEITQDLNVEKRLSDLEPLYQSILNDSSNDPKNIIKKNGKLSHSLYRLLFFLGGSASIVDLVTRIIAAYKLIRLGRRCATNPLPADFEAFLCEDSDRYANWTVNHAYESFKIIPNHCPNYPNTLTTKEKKGIYSSTLFSLSKNKLDQKCDNRTKMDAFLRELYFVANDFNLRMIYCDTLHNLVISSHFGELDINFLKQVLKSRNNYDNLPLFVDNFPLADIKKISVENWIKILESDDYNDTYKKINSSTYHWYN